ncbi:MAG: hypothetical protein AAFX52_16030, partial [Pseudomonadota bacterium]
GFLNPELSLPFKVLGGAEMQNLNMVRSERPTLNSLFATLSEWETVLQQEKQLLGEIGIRTDEAPFPTPPFDGAGGPF